MQVLNTLIAAAAAVVGVILGGMLTFWVQRFNVRETARNQHKRDEREACIAYLAACRKYRRYVLHSDVKGELVPPTQLSRGTVVIEGSSPYEHEVSDAMARLMIVVRSDEIQGAATELATQLGVLLRSRIREGKGQVPDAIVLTIRDLEISFAAVARHALQNEG